MVRLEDLINQFETKRLERMKVNEAIRANKNYWSRAMIRAQNVLSRKLSRECNELKMKIETHSDLSKRQSDSFNFWKPKK